MSDSSNVDSKPTLLRSNTNDWIVLFPTYVLGPHIHSVALVEILSESVAYPDMSLYASYMPHRYLQPKVRAFIDHLLEHFGPQPGWDQPPNQLL